MLVILEDGPSARRVYRHPRTILSARSTAEVPAVLAAIDAALQEGRHVAGWLGYELGYALEPRLQSLMPDAGPLLHLGVFDSPFDDAPQPSGRAYAGPLQWGWDEAAYGQRFRKVKAYIAAGDIYQANLSFRAPFAFAGDPLALYEALRSKSGAGHCAYVDDGTRQLLSLSPELFFAQTQDGVLTARPMKGTAPRDSDDEAARQRLAASEKDRAENLMIVDLIRNDLGRIAETGTVEVRDLFQVETYPTLHAMVSTVSARKRSSAGAADILKALFPCGSITGAPKIRAMEILRELETSRRGAYCGAIGYFVPGEARFNVAIRTLTVTGETGELGIGGGVVQDSQEALEYAECRLKARFFESARRPLELIETLRFENGFVREDRHLTRMAASARLFGLPFDRAKAEQALARAVEKTAGPLRVRLSLDETGSCKAVSAPLPPNPGHWTWHLSLERTQSKDLLLRHKTNWRDLYDREAAQAGTDEVLFRNERGEITEGARSNVFVRRGAVLLTPPLECGVLNGCLRAELIEQKLAREERLTPEDLKGDVFLGNSLRGLIPARPG
jgi:para-aminobenzoate synthetase/4-amino-4-deoxychorismate lyase